MESRNKHVIAVSKKLMDAVGIEDGEAYYAYYEDGLMYIRDGCKEAEEDTFEAGAREGLREGMNKGFASGYRLGYSDAMRGAEYDETYHGDCGVDCNFDCKNCCYNRKR